MPQLTEAEVRVGRMVPTVATATDEGSSMVDLWWKSGSTTGGAARSASATWASSSASTCGSAGRAGPSNTRAVPRSTVSSTTFSRSRRPPVAVDVVEHGAEGGGRVPLADAGLGGRRHPSRLDRFVEQVADRLTEHPGRLCRYQQAGLAGYHHVGYGVDRRGYHRYPGADRLDERAGQPLVPTGEREHVQRGQQLGHVLAVPEQPEPLGEATLAGPGQQPPAQRTVPDPQAPHIVPVDLGQGVDPLFRRLLVVHPADRADQPYPGRQPEPAAGYATRRGTGGIADRVHRGRDGPHLVRSDQPAPDGFGGHPAADGEAHVGPPAEPALDADVETAPPGRLELVERETVVGGHDAFDLPPRAG